MKKQLPPMIQPPEPIDLPFSVASLRLLLGYGAAEDSPYTHEQIADWAYRFWLERARQYDSGEYELGDDPLLDRAEEIAEDIDAQWDMYITSPHVPTEDFYRSLATVQLPRIWFEQWQRELDAPLTE